MAPRSCARAAQHAATAVPVLKITQLPEAVLAKCLGFLDLKERLGPASLACKRFAAAACSPELLRQMDVGELPHLPAVRSLTAFLARHGQHLQRLTLSCQDDTGEGTAAAAAAAATCLSIAGAGGQLTDLDASGCICSSDWLAVMPLLRRLALQTWLAGSDLHVSQAIGALTALSVLELGGDLNIPASTCLPRSLERLTLQSDSSDAFPHQVAHLPRLASLSLDGCGYSAANLNVLSRLSGSLTHLDIKSGWIPGSLSALTQLRDLRLWDSDTREDDAALSSVLPCFSQLTCLVAMTDDAAVPAALAGLSQLQLCYLYLYVDMDTAAPPLPAGPWLASLRWLRYNVDGLMSSTGALGAAAGLQFLQAANSSLSVDWASPAAAAFFDWLEQHPPLCRMQFEATSGQTFNSDHFAARAMRLGRRRPSLVLEGGYSSDSGMYELIVDE